MAKRIKLTESDLNRIVRRVISEDLEMETELPECMSLMKSDAEKVGGGSELTDGPFDRITANFTVSPKYQGYTIYKKGKPFCFIGTNNY
jgi:hypothetical protein